LSKMWSGRVSQPLDTQFEQWQRSFAYDRRLLPFECAASRAHARALAAAGVLSAAELKQIVGGLDELEARCARDASVFDGSDAEDVHHFVEQQLVALIGDAGLKLHTGRSRNEQIATDLRLFVRDAIQKTRLALAELQSALCARARELGTAAMPAYTHLQRAEPILAAHWLLAYVEMFARDSERLADASRRADSLPLGSGAVAGCTIAVDREAMARDLGFAGITANSLDATSDRDFAIEYLNALALAALHLSRMAEDFVLYSTVEFGFVRLADAFSTGSSAMPQKKNPDPMELLRGKTGRVQAAAQTVAFIVKGLPLAYNRDLQEMQEPLFAATDSILGSLDIAHGFIRTVGFDTSRMHQAASTGYLNATAAANYLVHRGVPFRRAHEIVGKAVRLALDKHVELEHLPLADLRALSPEFSDDFAAALALARVIAEHDVPGGTAPARVAQALAAAESRLAEQLAALKEEAGAHA
jgi:argininosuccinate lyase